MTYLVSHHLLHRAVKAYIWSLHITFSDSSLCHINTWLLRGAVMLSRSSTSSKYGTENIGERPKSLKARCMILFPWCLYWCLAQQRAHAAWLVSIPLREQAELWLLNSGWLMVFHNGLFTLLLDLSHRVPLQEEIIKKDQKVEQDAFKHPHLRLTRNNEL